MRLEEAISGPETGRIQIITAKTLRLVWGPSLADDWKGGRQAGGRDVKNLAWRQKPSLAIYLLEAGESPKFLGMVRRIYYEL